jgi:SAM-dependent methyltransferase
MPLPDELRAAYDEGYGPYAPPTVDAKPPSFRSRAIDRVRHWWHVLDGMPTADRLPLRGRVLDVGAGEGYNVMRLRRRGIDAVGLEPNHAAVEAARAAGLPMIEGAFEDSDLTGPFDTILLDQVLEHFADPLAAMRRARELLAPCGRVAMLTPNVRSLFARAFGSEWAHYHAPFHLHLFGRDQARRLLEQAGFHVERVSTISPPFWLAMSLDAARHRSQATEYVLPSRDWQPHPIVRVALAPLLRLVDLLGRGDCLMVVGRVR